MYDAFILAAGFGTRLRPLTSATPKPLVPVCGVPMLSYSLALCAANGLTRVVVNGHYLAEALESWRGQHEGCEVELSIERPDILGTGGGLAHIAERLAEVFAVVNGDTLCDVDLRAMVDKVPAGGAAMALRVHPEDARDKYGVVAYDAAGCVTDIKKLVVTDPVGAEHRDAHFTGIHAMHREMLKHVPEGFSDIVRTAYIAEVPHRRIRAHRHEGTWLDVGDPAAYLETNLAALRGEVALPLDPWDRAADGCRHGARASAAGGGFEGPCWVGERAFVQGSVATSVIGSDARISAGARLERCVVWDGVEVPPGDYCDVVFAGGEPVQI